MRPPQDRHHTGSDNQQQQAAHVHSSRYWMPARALPRERRHSPGQHADRSSEHMHRQRNQEHTTGVGNQQALDIDDARIGRTKDNEHRPRVVLLPINGKDDFIERQPVRKATGEYSGRGAGSGPPIGDRSADRSRWRASDAAPNAAADEGQDLRPCDVAPV